MRREEGVQGNEAMLIGMREGVMKGVSGDDKGYIKEIR